MATPADVAVGIDVAKAQLDIAVEPTGAAWRVPRAPRGLRRLARRRSGLQADRTCVEARRVRGR